MWPHSARRVRLPELSDQRHVAVQSPALSRSVYQSSWERVSGVVASPSGFKLTHYSRKPDWPATNFSADLAKANRASDFGGAARRYCTGQEAGAAARTENRPCRSFLPKQSSIIVVHDHQRSTRNATGQEQSRGSEMPGASRDAIWETARRSFY